MTESPAKTSLVIGGTGMLAAATRWVARHSTTTILVSRHASRFAANSDCFLSVDADWNNAQFSDAVRKAILATSSPRLALLWLHNPEPILSWLIPTLDEARIVLVLGSMDGQPHTSQQPQRIARVRLGSIRTPHGRRWLTDEEISSGAIQTLRDGQSRIVGALGPLQ